MKIFMLCDFYAPSLSYQENALAREYRRAGHEVMVATSTTESVFDYVNDRYDPARPASRDVAEGIHIARLPYRINLLNRVRLFARLDALLGEFRPDMIFVHDIMFNLGDCVRHARRHAGVRLVLDCHADYSNSAKNRLSLLVLHRGLRKRVLMRALPHLDAIYPIVPASLRFLHEVYSVPLQRMTLLPLGSDQQLATALQREDAGAALRRQLGFGGDEVVFVSGGKIAPAKRIDTLIAAFGSLPDPQLRLVIVGDAAAEDRDYLARCRVAAAADARVRFTGWLDTEALHRHLAMADAAVFAASQSIVWQQAIGMGCPLILGEPRAGAGGDQDATYLNRGDNIIFAPPGADGDAAAPLAAAMHRLAGDRALRAQMAQAAAKIGREFLDWRRIAEQTLGTHAAADATPSPRPA